MNSGKVLLGLIAGIGAGVALGVLFAPDKGANTRKKISTKRDDYLEGIKTIVEDTLVNAINVLEYAKGEADVFFNNEKS